MTEYAKDIAERWRRFRVSLTVLDESREPELIDRMAGELGLSVAALTQIIAAGDGPDELMQRMMKAFGLDPGRLRDEHGAIVREIEVLCALCVDKERCARELAKGTAAANAPEFCPNAKTLKDLE